MTQVLITSADERSWELDQPSVFLGEWCCRPNRKKVWGAMDAKVAPPFYPDLKTRLDYANESKLLHDEMIKNLAIYFNQVHGKSYDTRFWKILVGPFLTRYIRIVMNRYLTLEQFFKKHKVSQTIQLVSNKQILPFDTLSLINLSENELWNHKLNIWLIKDFFCNELEIIRRQVGQVQEQKIDFSTGNIKKSSRLIEEFSRVIFYKVNSLLCRMNADSSALFYKTYLSKKMNILLQAYFKQVPCLWSTPEFDGQGKNDCTIAREPLLGIIAEKKKGYHHALEKYLHKIIPEVFLEKFTTLEHFCDKLAWPKSPKLIFTSNAFDCDEPFKLWTAKKVNKGAKYIVAQHGSSYGVNPFTSPTVEEETSDRFITWGWAGSKNHAQGFCTLTPNQRRIKESQSGGLLLVELMLRRTKFIWDVHAEYNVYINNQVDFLNGLGTNILNETTVRLHPISQERKGDKHKIFTNKFPKIVIDNGNKSFLNIIKNFRLFVITYDSTGLLELLNMNIPVVAFWDKNGFDQISPSAWKYYNHLIKVRILFFSPESASNHVNQIWEDIDAWWLSNDVQNARKSFCQQFAAIEKRPIKKLAELLS